jgi:catechol 2,3-dioxygenase-like lactoylglutathione lyase family enzyme
MSAQTLCSGMLALSLLASTAAGSARADDAINLTEVRRITIATADVEASLRFYRDLLGFTVAYDQPVEGRQLDLYSPGASAGRVIALARNNRLGGSVGLFWSPEVKAKACEPLARGGETAMLILTDNLAGLIARLDAAKVPFLARPVSYDKSRGPTDAVTVFDPNCVRVAFAEIKNETLSQSTAK